MKYIIYITIALLSAFCFNNAMAQGVSMFGALRAQDTSKTRGQLVIQTLTNSDTNKVLTADAAGRFYYVTKSNGTPIDTTLFVRYTDTTRSGIIATYYYVDSLYSTIGTHDSLVKYTDSLTNIYVTGYRLDTAKTNLRNSIATKLNISDTATMLTPYLRKGDTTSLSNRIDTKVTKGGDATGATLVIGTNDPNRVDWEANNTTAVSIHNGGNVSVGSTVDDGTKLKVTGTLAATGRTNIGSLALGTKSPLLTVSGASASTNTTNIATYGAIAVRADIAPSGGEGGGVYFGSRDGVHVLLRSSLLSGGGNTTGDFIISTRNAIGDVSLTDRFTINSLGNVWVGTPNAAVRTNSNFTTASSANFGANALYTISDYGNIGSNYYYNGTNFLAKNNVPSNRINWASGNHDFDIATAVTANTTIPFITAMRIANTTGFVGLNRTNPSQRLTVGGQVKIDTINHRSVTTDSILVRSSGIVSSRLPENYYTGWAQYIDSTYTSGSPFTILSTTTDTLENNANGVINGQKPIDATGELYNSTTKKVMPIDTFDAYILEIRFTAVSTANFDHFEVGLDIGGSLGVITKQTQTFSKNAGTAQEFKVTFSYFTGATFVGNGGAVVITTNGGDVSFYDINYLVTRTHKAR